MDDDLSVASSDDRLIVAITGATGFVGSKLVETLLERGADPSAQDANGDTALHLACERGDTAMARLLISLGARQDAQNKLGLPPRLSTT